MGCVMNFVAVPFKLAGSAASGAGILLVVSGYKTRHPGLCALGTVLGVVGMILGCFPFSWLGAATAIAGGYGFNRFRRLPR